MEVSQAQTDLVSVVNFFSFKMSDIIRHGSPLRTLKAIKKIAEGNLRNEVCGFVGFDREGGGEFVIKEAKNAAEDPQHYFLINPLEYLLFKEDYLLVGLFHSHLVATEEPSEFDKKMAANCCNPFLIYSLNTKKINIYEPQNMECDVNILRRLKDAL
jgi:proteasome lid subunit RPN8/RPN11